MFNAQEVLGQLMGAGMSPSSGRRIDNALGGQGGGGGGILEQILGGLQQGGGGRAGGGGGGPLGGLGDLLRPQGGNAMPGGSTRIGSNAGAGGGLGSGSGGLGGGGGGLGDLLGSLGGALGGGQSGRGGQGNPLAAGGLGALAGILLGRGKSSMGNAVGGAGIAILGSLAMQALRKMGEQRTVEAQGRSMPLPGGQAHADEEVPLGVRPPENPAEEAVLADHALILLQAMISAAKADGQIDGGEMQRIIGKLEEGGADGEARDFVLQEMRKPLDIDALVAGVRTPALAAEVYAASLLAIEVDTPAEEAYLRQLAQKLRLDPVVTQHLHDSLGAPNVA